MYICKGLLTFSLLVHESMILYSPILYHTVVNLVNNLSDFLKMSSLNKMVLILNSQIFL